MITLAQLPIPFWYMNFIIELYIPVNILNTLEDLHVILGVGAQGLNDFL